MENMANSGFSLRDFYYILFRHKVLITILLFSTLLTVVFGVYVLPETYVAKAGILVKMGRENVSIPTVPRGVKEGMKNHKALLSVQ